MTAFKLRVSKVAVKVERARMEGKKEERKRRKSILIHKADKWVEHDVVTQEYHLAERVTAAINRASTGWPTSRTPAASADGTKLTRPHLSW